MSQSLLAALDTPQETHSTCHLCGGNARIIPGSSALLPPQARNKIPPPALRRVQPKPDPATLGNSEVGTGHPSSNKEQQQLDKKLLGVWYKAFNVQAFIPSSLCYEMKRSLLASWHCRSPWKDKRWQEVFPPAVPARSSALRSPPLPSSLPHACSPGRCSPLCYVTFCCRKQDRAMQPSPLRLSQGTYCPPAIQTHGWAGFLCLLMQPFKPRQVCIEQRSGAHALHPGSKTLQQMGRNEEPGWQSDFKLLHMFAKQTSVPVGLQQLSPRGRVAASPCLLPLHRGTASGTLEAHRSAGMLQKVQPSLPSSH